MDAISPLPSNPNSQIDYRGRDLREIWLAGGCFWGVGAFISRLPGVAGVSVGYANGRTENPTYRDVCSHRTGFAETAQIYYDPALISLKSLLEEYFRIIDPTSLNCQGHDCGDQYRTGIYYRDPADLPVIQAVLAAEQKKYDRPVVTEVETLRNFYPAEEEHQNYLEKNPGGYCHVNLGLLSGAAKPSLEPERYRCPDDAELKYRLTPLQYQVVRQNQTERPFTGENWDRAEPGLYVDVVTGEPLFTSQAKFDSGCGWPSFTQPVDPAVLRERRDVSHGLDRIEIRSRAGDSHLGHVFADGPAAAGGRRYCINSAALRFIPLAAMAGAGYADLISLVDDNRDAVRDDRDR